MKPIFISGQSRRTAVCECVCVKGAGLLQSGNDQRSESEDALVSICGRNKKFISIMQSVQTCSGALPVHLVWGEGVFPDA
jgi:hypothetical protein